MEQLKASKEKKSEGKQALQQLRHECAQLQAKVNVVEDESKVEGDDKGDENEECWILI